MKKFLLLLFFLATTGSVFSQTVYITKTGAKYHKENCVHLRRSSIGITLEEAVERGYEACKVCRPASGAGKVSATGTDQTAAETQSKSSTSVQCSGKTKKGARCKRMTTNGSGRCYQH